ncbi:MAG: NAD(P)-dependent oxidoreductase [Desulfobacteraceae bacterium]|nr:NAD(P)-dependent oxidoreductase [Desulfobacteraceae bacterium]
MNVTFIGLGIMGSRMAKNLLKNKVKLTVFNRSDAPVKELKGLGATGAESYQGAVTDADVVFTMLSTPEVVEQIVIGENGFISEMKANAIWVDCSTVNPSFSLTENKIAEKNNVRFLDAPVAGTKPHAENAELVFFAGGSKEDLENVESLFNFMGSKVVHVGEVGKGSSFKMLVNSLLAQSMLIFSETLLFGQKMGLSKDFLLDTLPNLVVSAPFTKAKAELIRADDYDVQFPLEWMHKDLHLVALTAYEKGQPLYLANLAKEVYGNAKNCGLGREDFASIYRFLSEK